MGMTKPIFVAPALAIAVLITTGPAAVTRRTQKHAVLALEYCATGNSDPSKGPVVPRGRYGAIEKAVRNRTRPVPGKAGPGRMVLHHTLEVVLRPRAGSLASMTQGVGSPSDRIRLSEVSAL
jgi:hypothetical protein